MVPLAHAMTSNAIYIVYLRGDDGSDLALGILDGNFK